MKISILILFLAVSSALCLDLKAEPKYITDFDDAMAQAQAAGKPMIAMFYGKW